MEMLLLGKLFHTHSHQHANKESERGREIEHIHTPELYLSIAKSEICSPATRHDNTLDIEYLK